MNKIRLAKRTWWMEIKLDNLAMQITGVEGTDVADAIKGLKAKLNDSCFDVTSIREHYDY